MVTDDVEEHLDQAKKLYDTMKRMGLEIKEVDLCLNSLPEEYDNLIVAWDVSGNSLSFDLLRTKIVNIHREKKDRKGSNALFAKKQVKNKKENRKCFECGKVGHIAANCKHK